MKVARILLDGFMLEDEPGGRGDGGYFATILEVLVLYSSWVSIDIIYI